MAYYHNANVKFRVGQPVKAKTGPASGKVGTLVAANEVTAGTIRYTVYIEGHPYDFYDPAELETVSRWWFIE